MKRLLHILSLALCLPALLVSCIYEDEVQCPCEVRFVYDMNMEFADAFPTQVDDVTLLVFDADGRYVTTCIDQGAHLDGNYRMALDLQPGSYQLLVWAGLCTDDDCYTLVPADMVPGVTTLDEVQLHLNCQGKREFSNNLSDLWHGLLTDFRVERSAPVLGTIRLTKNTNRFRVMLQAEGKQLSADDYLLGIHAANHRVACDNTPIDDCSVLSYRPYLQGETKVENEGRSQSYSAVIAEMATLRLMADNEHRFTVRNVARGETLSDIDLIRYLDLMRLDEHADMSLQEFLDRENTWNIILLLGVNETLLSIQINSWILVINQAEL